MIAEIPSYANVKTDINLLDSVSLGQETSSYRGSSVELNARTSGKWRSFCKDGTNFNMILKGWQFSSRVSWCNHPHQCPVSASIPYKRTDIECALSRGDIRIALTPPQAVHPLNTLILSAASKERGALNLSSSSPWNSSILVLGTPQGSKIPENQRTPEDRETHGIILNTLEESGHFKKIRL